MLDKLVSLMLAALAKLLSQEDLALAKSLLPLLTRMLTL